MLPPLPGEVPPTIFVPYAMAASEWKVPFLPVKPWQMTLVFLSIRMDMVSGSCRHAVGEVDVDAGPLRRRRIDEQKNHLLGVDIEIPGAAALAVGRDRLALGRTEAQSLHQLLLGLLAGGVRRRDGARHDLAG